MSKTELKELEAATGTSMLIHVLDPDGNRSGSCVELSYDADARLQLYFHSPETCHPRCEPVVDLTFVRAEDYEDKLAEQVRNDPAYAKAKAAFERLLGGQASEKLDLLDALEAVFGEGSVMTMDENGIRPARSKNKHRH